MEFMAIDRLSPSGIEDDRLDPGLRIEHEPPAAKTAMEHVNRFIFSIDRETVEENLASFQDSLSELIYDPERNGPIRSEFLEILQQIDC